MQFIFIFAKCYKLNEEPLQIFDLQKIMYKDRYPAPHHLSYSAVTSYNTSSSNSSPYERYHTKDLPQQMNNNNYRSSLKNEGNSDLAFLRNTVGPISTLHTENNYLKVNDQKKADISLRQTMNVTSDLRERIKFSQNFSTKRTGRSQTVNQAELPSTTDKKEVKNDDRLQKIMNKYDKKSQTKQALKLLQELKQLKKKQQQLKKQRKTQPLKQQQTNAHTTGSYDYNSPVNFSKKNKIDFYTPTYDKKQFSTNANSPQGQTNFNARNKKNSADLTNQQMKINIIKNPSKSGVSTIKQQFLNNSNSLSISNSSQNGIKLTANLKSYGYQSSSPNYKYQDSYSFTKGKQSNERDESYNVSKKYSTNETNFKPFQKMPKNNISSPNNSNVLNVTTRDNTNSYTLSKSPNSKLYSSKHPTQDLVSSYVSNSSKTYSTFNTTDYNYSKKSEYDLSASKRLYNSPKQNFSNRKLSIQDFVLGKNLGEGKFGTVFQAFQKKTKCLYALKKIPKEIIKSHWMVDQFILEVKIQNFLNHPNILALHGYFDDADHVYILLEYMEQGTLFLHLKKNSTLGEKQAATKLKQIASAIQYLHENGIAHRDLKPENIVMSHGVCKLCDFGWATICDQRRKTYCGTFDYAAPQILQGTQYDMSVDLWCLGILAYEILVGKAPFYHISRKQTMKKIMNCQNEKIHYPSTMSYQARSFIEQLLRKNPEQRLKSQDLLKHPFLRLADN